MRYNEETRLLLADADKWLTIDNQIFVKSMFLAQKLNKEDIQEVSDADKIQAENNQNDTDNESII
jgi:hypothetical protein